MGIFGDAWDAAKGVGKGIIGFADKATGGNIDANYAGPVLDWAQDDQSRYDQLNQNDALRLQAEGRGPSVASAQMQQGLRQNQNAQQAAAASARGGALSQSMAQRNAMTLGAQQAQQTAGQTAVARAGEQMAAQQQLSQNIAAQRQADQQRIMGIGNMQNQAAGIRAGAQVGQSQAAAGLFGGMLSAAGGMMAMSDANAKTMIRPLDSDENEKQHIVPMSDKDLPAWSPGPTVRRAIPVVGHGWHGRHLPQQFMHPSDYDQRKEGLATTPPVEVAATRPISSAARAALVSDVRAKTLFAPLDAPDPYAQHKAQAENEPLALWQNTLRDMENPYTKQVAADDFLAKTQLGVNAGRVESNPWAAQLDVGAAPAQNAPGTMSMGDWMRAKDVAAGRQAGETAPVPGDLNTAMQDAYAGAKSPIDEQPIPIQQISPESFQPIQWATPDTRSEEEWAQIANGYKPSGGSKVGPTWNQKAGVGLMNFGAGMQRQPAPFQYMSDARVKTAVSDVSAKTNTEGGSPEIKDFLGHLQPYQYEYKPGMGDGPGERYGVMAQDLAKSPVGKTMVERDPSTGLLAIDVTKGFGPVLAAEADLHDRLAKIEASLKGKK